MTVVFNLVSVGEKSVAESSQFSPWPVACKKRAWFHDKIKGD